MNQARTCTFCRIDFVEVESPAPAMHASRRGWDAQLFFTLSSISLNLLKVIPSLWPNTEVYLFCISVSAFNF